MKYTYIKFWIVLLVSTVFGCASEKSASSESAAGEVSAAAGQIESASMGGVEPVAAGTTAGQPSVTGAGNPMVLGGTAVAGESAMAGDAAGGAIVSAGEPASAAGIPMGSDTGGMSMGSDAGGTAVGGMTSGGMPEGGSSTGGGAAGAMTVDRGGEPVPEQLCDATYPAHTVGIQVCRPNSSPGYTLFHPMPGETTYLIDALGRVVHEWAGTARPGLSVALLPDGRLVRSRNLGRTSIQAGGASGGIEIVAWDGTVEWQWSYSTDDYRTHHDFEALPNGNILLITWNVHRGDEVTGVGRRDELIDEETGEIWSDEIIEVRPVGADGAEIVWRWRAWDHLIQDQDATKPNFGVIAEHPHRIDVNTGRAARDWLHSNSIDYHPELDLIVLSVRNFNEVWIIDKSTTTDEAATSAGGRYGRGGDLLYRWGHPSMYGAEGPQQLFGQHDAQWIEPGHPGAGHLLVYNNGQADSDRDYSTVDELVLPALAETGFERQAGTAFGPDAPLWSYRSDGFFSSRISGAQRMPNGNTLICEGREGRLFEVTPQGDVVWDYINPVGRGDVIHMQGQPLADDFTNPVFRARRYPVDYPAFDGRDLSPQRPIEE